MNIFLSYSSKDRALVVESLVNDLQKAGHIVWYDQAKLRGGQAWWKKILEAIRNCDVFIFALSPNSLASQPCKQESIYAYQLQKRIVPVMLVPVKTNLLPRQLAETQIIDYTNPSKDTLLELISALNSLPDKLSLPDPLPEEPEIPLAPLIKINSTLDSPKLDFEEQRSLLFDLRIMLRESSEAKEDVKILLKRLGDREDTYHQIAEEIMELQRETDDKPVPAEIETVKNGNRSNIGLIAAFIGALVLVGTIAFVMARLGIGSNLGQGALTQSVSLESSTYTPTHLSPTNTFETTMTAIPTPPVVPTLTPMVKPLSPEKVTVTWYVGLGTGVQTEQMVSEKAVVDKFNKSQDKIELKVVFADNTTIGADTLNKLISAGRIPDIVGPMGMLGSNYFENEWLDLQPLVDKTQYTIPDFPSNLIKVYQQGGGLYGIPFAVYPGLFYYNKDLFDKADLAYPPINFGDKYVLDGKSVDWNWDTVATIAKKLTLDSKDNDANSDKFDPTKVVQFGFIHQWDPIRSQLSTFGGASVLNSQSGNVQIPDNWRAGAKWLWNGIWKEHFIPSQSYQNGELLNSNAFATGKIAMARTMLWYTCCLSELKAKWDLAPVPAYNGQYYAPADADTFRIDKRTKHPDEAFAVLLYLLDTAAPDLLPVYGAYPARPDLQDKFLKDLAIRFPTVKNWSIVLPSLDYIVLPHHESYFPNFAQVQSRFTDFESLLYGDSGGYINIDQEVDKLQFDLQSLMKTTD